MLDFHDGTEQYTSGRCSELTGVEGFATGGGLPANPRACQDAMISWIAGFGGGKERRQPALVIPR